VSIKFGVQLSQAAAQSLTGQLIDPEIFDLCPTGNLLFCVVEKTPEDYGHIRMVSNYKDPAGCGYIIACGPYAGSEPSMGGVSAIGVVGDKPEDLLGLHVIFGAHSGVPIRVTMTEARFNAQVVMMASRDIQGIDQNPVPLGDRIQKKILSETGSSGLILHSDPETD